MVRPIQATKTDEGGESPRPPEFTGVAPESLYPDMDNMFGNHNGDGDEPTSPDPSSDPQHAQTDQDGDDFGEDFVPSDGFDSDGLFDDNSFSFDDRTPAQSAAEALRRSRRTQEAVVELSDKLDSLMTMMQTGGNNQVASGIDTSDLGFSEDEMNLINEAAKTNPAAAFSVMQEHMAKKMKQYADNTVTTQIAIDRDRRDAERNTVRLYPQMKNPTHPFRRAVMARYRELQKGYQARGIDPSRMPELIQYAAQEIATESPQLVGATSAKTRLREESRRRQAENTTIQSRQRSTHHKKDDLPELTEADVARGRRMGLNMNDPKVRQALQIRRRHYMDRRR